MMKVALSAAALAAALAGCAGTTTTTSTITRTVTVTAPVSATATARATAEPSTVAAVPAPAASYGPTHAYAVGTPQGGLDESIPPGRYRASTVADSGGYVFHCASVVCTQSGDHTDSDSISQGAPVIVEIPSSDVAIYLWDVTLVPVS
ncbi:hypothetical protein ACGFK1_11745 [Mycobacterium sp. NPDC048908]|uniref:hypothetical protein n=1 Tax=Mycobacterium sp. NPDC048908 TaxID=3364292 RepID=UPI0037135C25